MPPKTYPMHQIIPYRNAKKLKTLLGSKKYDLNEKNSDGKTVLILATDIDENDEILEILFDEEALDVDLEDDNGNRALHFLAMHGNLKFIERLREKFPDSDIDPENISGDTPLIMASKMDHADVVLDLFKKGANINHQNGRGLTALHCAASSGYIKTTRVLVNLGANLSTAGDLIPIDWGFDDINDIFMGKEEYPIHEAVSCQNLRKLKILLSKGAFDINEEDDAGKTPLLLAADLPDNKSNFEILELLLRQENIDISKKDEYDNSILHYLASRGKLNVIQNILAVCPRILINEPNDSGETPLMLAAKMDHSDVIESLCGKDADVNVKNKKGLTALHLAAMNGFLDSTRALIKSGAHLSIQDNYGFTPLAMSVHWGFEDVTEVLRSKDPYPVHSAVTYRNIRKLKRLLEDHIFDINECNEEGKPLLVIAADKDEDEMVSLLLEQQHVNPLIADKDGYTVLHVLALKGKLAFMKTIFQKFPEIDVNMQNNNKETPLMCAAKTDSAGVIHYLFERGANLNHQNHKGYTALCYAANNGCLVSAKMLVKLGADLKIVDNYGCTPLILAAGWGYLDLTDYLIKLGGEGYINLANRNGETALWKAVLRRRYDVVNLLLDRGAAINPGKFKSPIMRACDNQDVEMVRLLLKGGATYASAPDRVLEFIRQNSL